MKKYLLLFAVLFTFCYASAQNKAIIKGTVVDSAANIPFEMATVALLDARDTLNNLLSYTLTDKKGEFTLHNASAGNAVKLFVSFVGYQPFRKTFTLKGGQTLDLGKIYLKMKELQGVTIRAERMPIVIRKDTIEFDAEAFKTRPNAAVEDLLKKLPGVEVANDGSLTVAGKEVSKVMIDGKEFFANDPRIATKNLDAELIAKVQIYDDREDDPDHKKSDNEVKKIINLKFKKALKKSIFGKVYAGYGTNQHYQSGGLLNMFRDTLQVSILGSSNNLNNTGFDYDELQANGGLNRGGNSTFGSLGFGGGSSGRQKATSTGVNINTDYGKKLKVNLAYLYSRSVSAYNSITNRQQLISDTSLITAGANGSRNINNNHTISSTVSWRPNDATQIRYTPSVNIISTSNTNDNSSNSYSNFVNPINNSINTTGSKRNNLQLNQYFNYNKQLKKKGSSVNINHDLNINPGSGNSFENSNLTSYIVSFPSYTFKQRANTDNRYMGGSLSAGYRYQITSKLNTELIAYSQYSHSIDKVTTYEYDPVTGLYDSLVLVKSNDLTRNSWTQKVTPVLTYEFPHSITLITRFDVQSQQVNNRFNRNVADIDKRYVFWLPSATLRYKSMSADYRRMARIPNISDLIPYTVTYSPLFSVTGNPYLTPTTIDNFSLFYNNYNFEKGLNFYLNGSVSFEKNSIFRQRTLDAQLAETSMPINRDGRYNYNLNGYISKQFKKSKSLRLRISSNLSFSKAHDFFVINRQDGFQNAYRGNWRTSISIAYKEVFTFDPEYNLSKTFTTYSGVDYGNQQYITHNINSRFNIFMPRKFNVEGTYSYRYNPLIPTGFQRHTNLLNLSLAHQFMQKDRAEIKLSCYDIFNQNIGSTRSIRENIITDTQSEIIKRYFMLTLQYKFNKTTVK
jgi:hypothetical protein